MSDTKARVRAREGVVCPDFNAMEHGVRRMIGYVFSQVSPGQWGWAPTDKVESVEKCREIAMALAEGDLLAADKETAEWAESVTRKPVSFESSLGSE